MTDWTGVEMKINSNIKSAPKWMINFVSHWTNLRVSDKKFKLMTNLNIHHPYNRLVGLQYELKLLLENVVE